GRHLERSQKRQGVWMKLRRAQPQMPKDCRLEVRERHPIAQLLECNLIHGDNTPTSRSTNPSPTTRNTDLPVLGRRGLYIREKIFGDTLAVCERGHCVSRFVSYPRII
ncbi:hypothetical protein A2U01_0059743, partial [Trifolium medium]|nr:hypothetical protein [Trifolium medium]